MVKPFAPSAPFGILASGLAILCACGTATPPSTLGVNDVTVTDGAADVAKDASATDVAAPQDLATDVPAPADVGPDAAPDAQPPKDALPTKEQICKGYADEYLKQLPAVLACKTDSACNTQTPDKLTCACGAFANAGLQAWTSVQEASQQFYSHQCGTCFKAECADDPTKPYYGVCKAGQCGSKEATCADLAKAWDTLKSDAQVCTDSSDCTGSIGIAVNCDACKLPANAKHLVDTAAQGKYSALLKKLWEDLGCDPPAVCACGPATGECVAGKCQAKQ